MEEPKRWLFVLAVAALLVIAMTQGAIELRKDHPAEPKPFTDRVRE